jgi:hypothetical protein
VHVVLQQNPSTQSPFAHSWAPVAQVPPEAFFVAQTPPLQNAFAAHPGSLAQVVGQLVPVWHAKGAHEGEPA